jgi:uncharacterized protein
VNIATLLIAWVLIGASPAAAEQTSLPALTQPVHDFAGLIDASSAAEMDRRIRALQTATGDVVVVVTVKTFAPYGSIEEFAVRLYERAGIGEKGKDNGALIVLAEEERRARIEVGYGLEGFITDGYAGDIIRTRMLPAFRSGRYGEGLLDGATQLINRIAEERGVTLTDVPPTQASRGARRENGGGLVRVIMIILFLLLISGGGGGLLNLLFGAAMGSTAGRRRRGGWSGWHGGVGGFGGGGFGGGGFGGGGGGFGGFGGGRSGGGGASGGW